MDRFRLMLLALAPLACAPHAEVPRGAAADRPVVFFDGFDDGMLDRGTWNVIGPSFWVNNEQQAYVDSSATIHFTEAEGAEGGVLVLQPRWSPGFVTPRGRTADFISGRIESEGKAEFAYGRYEARLRMPDAVGVWPAWWLLGPGRWPDAGEIDIMEYVGVPSWIGVALHGPGYSGDTPLVERGHFPEGQDVTAWHVYAVEWEEDDLRFFVDDRLVYHVTRAMVEEYGPWRFDEPKYLILNFALGGNYPFGVNGITEPYAGLPQATVDAIREGRVAMEVDWVRVLAPR